MRDRLATIGPVAAVAGALGLCCGLPIVLSLGVAGAIAGWSLQSWTLIGLGLVLAALGWARIVRGRRHGKPHQQPGATAPVEASAAQTNDGTTDLSTDATRRETQL